MCSQLKCPWAPVTMKQEFVSNVMGGAHDNLSTPTRGGFTGGSHLPPPSEAPPSLRSSGFRQEEALELAPACDACDASVQTAVGVAIKLINHNRNGPRPTCQWTQTDTWLRT